MVDHYRTYQTANFPTTSWKDATPSIRVPRYQPQVFQQVGYASPNTQNYKYGSHRRQVSGSSIASGPKTNTTHTHGHPMNRRNGSTSTTNTNSTGRSSINTTSTPQLYPSEAYVATLRKQKATVWSERAQHEDPRMMAAQKAAKVRASIEISGLSNPGMYGNINNHGLGGSSSASPASSLYGEVSGHQSLTLASSKIRSVSAGVGGSKAMKKVWKGTNYGHGHSHGGVIVMEPGSLIVGGVPTRLSASEVHGDSSDEECEGRYLGVGSGEQKRSISGRNSINSNHRKSFRESKSDGLHHRNSTGSKSSSSGSGYLPDESSIAEVSETPVTVIPLSHLSSPRESPKASPKTVENPVAPLAVKKQRQSTSGDYFFPPSSQSSPRPALATSASPPAIPPRAPTRPQQTRPPIKSNSSSNYSSSGSEAIGPLIEIEKVRTPAAELRRRGSVDEREARTRTMSGVRLYVANPDS